MKVAYKHLISYIPSKPNIDEISERFFQLGHEHEIEDEIFNMELTQTEEIVCLFMVWLEIWHLFMK